METNKNYIDECLGKFDKLYPCFMKVNHSIERRELFKNFLKQKLQEVEQNSLKNFTERLRGDLILHPDLENLNEIITKRLDKIIKN